MKTEDFSLQQYRRQGIAFPLTALSPREARRAYQQYLASCSTGQVLLAPEQRVFGHLLHPWIADLVSHPAILTAVRMLIGPDVLVWVSEFNAKAPASPDFFSWHQDMYYWHHQYTDPSNIPMLTAWLALTAANDSNGGMRVLPGSQHQMLEHTSGPSAHNMLTRGQKICLEVDAAQTVAVELDPGQFSLHHPLLCHASGANSSKQTRVGLVTRYMAPEVIPPVRPAYAWLVSGEDRHGHWDLLAPRDVHSGGELRQKSIEAVQNLTGARFK